MGSRVIETDEAGIEQSYFQPDASCDNLDCNCNGTAEELPVTITTTAEVEGDTYDDWELHFCSLDCLHVFLDESFPVKDAPSRTPLPGSSIQVFKPDV